MLTPLPGKLCKQARKAVRLEAWGGAALGRVGVEESGGEKAKGAWSSW